MSSLISAPSYYNPFTPTSITTLTGKTIDASKNTIKEAMNYDAYIYIDTDDGNKIVGRMNKTGVIYSHPANADVVFNLVINDLKVGNTQIGYHFLGGGGSIFVGPGVFQFANSVILYSNILIQGSGYSTIFKLINSHADNANSTVLKSSTWDTYSYNAGAFTTQQIQVGDNGIRLYDFSIDGNKSNNATVSSTNPNVVTGGGATMAQSWGHGIALYGSGFVLRDITVHDCPGAGIIIQSMPMPLDFLGGGNVFGNNLTNINIWNNGMNGLLVRAACYVTNLITCFNGEAGVDVQICNYFYGGINLNGYTNCFLDAMNHGTQSSLVYDQSAFEFRLCGDNNFISNTWIEAPWGAGDNLLLGSDGVNSPTTGYNLNKYCNRANIQGCYFDAMRKSGIYIGSNCALNQIVGCRCGGGGGDSTRFEAVAVTINSWYNDVDIQGDQLFGNGVGAGTATALVIGKTIGVAVNNVKLSFWNVSNLINWGNAGNGLNTINATLRQYTTAAFNVLASGSAAVDYTSNTINIDYQGNSTNPSRSHNGGLATFSGTGAQTAFVIPHLLYAAPNILNIFPNTADARGNAIATADATNITLTYPVAPPTGTNNVKLWWEARVSP